MKEVRCAKCGLVLPIRRVAIAKYAKIVNLVDPHECLEVPLTLDLGNPVQLQTEEKKFEQNLIGLNQKPLSGISTDDLRDRRSAEHVKDSSAPPNLLAQFRHLNNSPPAHEPEEEPPDA